jgi:hypothetical protein
VLTLQIQRVGSTGFGSVALPAALTASFGPNPLQDQLSLQVQLAASHSASLEVYSASGQLLEQRDLGRLPLGETAMLLSASSLPAGTLMFRVVLDNGTASPMRSLLRP